MRVVLVEDHRVLREGLRLLCERQAHWSVVGEASDCATALELVESQSPDILLLDLVLDDGSSMECLPRLRELSSGGIIVLTGAEDPCVHYLAREKGADSVVLKGEEPGLLFAEIERVVRQRGGLGASAHSGGAPQEPRFSA